MLYDALREHLAAASGEMTMSFGEVEAFVGPLPASARRRREWWANSRSHSQGRAWLDAGYRISAVDVLGDRVVFVPSDASSGNLSGAVVSDQVPGEVAPGSSEEQKRAERAMLEALSAEIGVPLTPRWIRLPSGKRGKVAKDLLELTLLASLAATPPRLILLISDGRVRSVSAGLMGQRRDQGQSRGDEDRRPNS